MTKTDDEIILELTKGEDTMKFSTYQWGIVMELLKELVSLKQKQQDELLNEFEKKVDEIIDDDFIEDCKCEMDDEGVIVCNTHRVIQKSKQLLKEIFTKTKEEW